MKKALAVAALSVLALTACGTEAQTQPVASDSVPAFSTLIHISLHPVEARVPSQPAVEAPAPVPVAVAPVVAVPAPVRHYQVTVPAPVQTPAPAVVPAPVVTPVVVATLTPTPAPAVTPAPCVGKRCGEPASVTVTSPICTTDNPKEACWHHIVVIPTPTPTPEPKEDQK